MTVRHTEEASSLGIPPGKILKEIEYQGKNFRHCGHTTCEGELLEVTYIYFLPGDTMARETLTVLND